MSRQWQLQSALLVRCCTDLERPGRVMAFRNICKLGSKLVASVTCGPFGQDTERLFGHACAMLLLLPACPLTPAPTTSNLVTTTLTHAAQFACLMAGVHIAVFASQTKTCISSHASSTKVQTSVRFIGHCRTVVPRYRTGYMSPWRPEFGRGASIYGKRVHTRLIVRDVHLLHVLCYTG